MRLLPLITALLLVGCASTANDRRVTSEETEPTLIAQTATYELHIRNGRVEQVVPNPDGSARVRVVYSEGELRQLYVDATGKPLPDGGVGIPIEVNGWVGLECVRSAKTCGTQPADAPRSMIVLRFQ